jgi:hypothetical protein
MSSRLTPSGARPFQRTDGVGPYRPVAGVSGKHRFDPAHFSRVAAWSSSVDTRQGPAGARILVPPAAMVAA